MKIVFSRKGYDWANGGTPSPVMPDGTMLSLPIPQCGDNPNVRSDLIHCAALVVTLVSGSLKPISSLNTLLQHLHLNL